MINLLELNHLINGTENVFPNLKNKEKIIQIVQNLTTLSGEKKYIYSNNILIPDDKEFIDEICPVKRESSMFIESIARWQMEKMIQRYEMEKVYDLCIKTKG